jgi:hypothetical protein
MAVNRKQDRGAITSERRRKDFLRHARERTQQELAKRSVDLASDQSSRGVMVAALAAAATLPLADASNLLGSLSGATHAQIYDAETIIQTMACRRSCT